MDFTQSEIENAEVIDKVGGYSKSLKICETDTKEKFIRISKDELEEVDTLRKQSRSVIENQIVVPEKLNSRGVNAPKTEIIGEYVVMEYIEGTVVANYEGSVDTDELTTVLAEMLLTGNQDATRYNVMITPEEELYAIDFDWASQDLELAISRFKESISLTMNDDLRDQVIDKVEQKRYE